MIVWLNVATVVFSLITCGFSAASIISMRRMSRRYGDSQSETEGDAK